MKVLGVHPGPLMYTKIFLRLEPLGLELVAASGQLMQRARHASRAGWILRAETYRRLCTDLGVPPTTQIADLDALAARRGLTRPGEVEAALDHDVATADQLVP